uniref:Ig-like domain-containing protein n=1 Tax=Nothobranchius furzeri TaxID=105023 RepID=A0A8C6Q8I5_NOTFU
APFQTHWISMLLPLLVLTLEVSRGQFCPRSCNCYQANEVHCTFRSLITIPPGLPAHTRRINLGFNSIKRLQEKSLAGLKRVELLMLHSNELPHLPDAVFRDMKSLQILKLSYNKLREISSSATFTGLTSLLRLYLDHNLLQHIHPRALLQLPSLRLLRLQGNRLHQLHPHALCTLSLLNTYYFSTLRHLDLSNNSLTTLTQESVVTAPLLETLNLQANPWSCDCRMNWFLSWSLAHPGLMKCPGGPQCPVCASPISLQGQGLLDQMALKCTPPIIDLPQKENLLDTDLSETQSTEAFREPLGSVSLGLSDQQGNSIDLTCNITHSTDSQDITPPPDLSWTSSSPLHLALSLSLECPIKAENYEKLWRILAYYSETAARFEREIMLSKAPSLAYRYRQVQETDGYYHTGVKASVKARPRWLLQSAISLQLNRAQSSGHKVQLIYSTRVSAQPDPTSHLSTSSSASHQWVMISINRTTAALAVVAGRKIELTCPLLSSGKPSVYWILPDGSKLNSPSSNLNGRLQASALDLLIQKALLSDAGIYYCVARAGKDVDVLPLRLAVEDSSALHSAEISGPPVTGEVGELVTLSCKMSGSPQPSVNWILPDGNVVRQGLAVSGELAVDLNGTLSLRKSSLRDAGYYRCIAVNQYGSDSQSFPLIINPPHISSRDTSFPRGPQSASGRSTKIQAPLFHQINEGSGDEEGQKQEKVSINKIRLSIPRPNRRDPVGKPQRRGHVKEGPSRRGGRPVSPTEQRRNQFQNRHRIATNKLRMDPKSWAEILEKIRQKAANATHIHSISRVNTTAESIQEENDKGTKGHGEGDEMSRGRAEGTGIEAETEGSSVDEAILREDQSQPIQPVHGDIQTIAWARINAETENGAETTETFINSTSETKTIVQKENESIQTTTANPVNQKELVTSNSFSGTNLIVSELNKVLEQGLNLNPAITRPQNPKRGVLPNLLPSSRPHSPWNARRKIGQRKRIKRPRIQPVTSPQPLPEPVTPISTTDMISTSLPEPAASHPAGLLTTCDHIKNAANNVALNALPTPFSSSHHISTSNFILPSLPPSPAHTDIMSHSGKIPHSQDSAFNSTSAPTHPDIVISEPLVPGTHSKAFTHGAHTHTERQTTLNNHVEILPSGEALEMNELDESHFSRTHSFIASVIPSVPSATSTVQTIITMPSTGPERAGYAGSTGSTSTTSEDTNSTTKTSAIHPAISPSTTIVIPVSSTTQQTSTTSTFTSTTTTTSNFPPNTTSARTSTTTVIPVIDIFSNTKDLHTSTSRDPISAVSRSEETPNSTTTKMVSTKTSPATTKQPKAGNVWNTTSETGIAITKMPSKWMPVTGQVDPRERVLPGTPNKNLTSNDWKRNGFNFIPDSHSRRFQQPPSSSLPAPTVRSRPRIVVPHSRTVSFPANGSAMLTCDAHGDPKPSITWTTVATGAVMSIHSRAQRFEVLPNGTLVIQNVQLQDRGTYVCSWYLLFNDRLLTTLDVWTRPPRMRLASYREVTVHQGGDIHLECQAEGVPTPLLSWVLPDRSSLTSSSNFSSRVTVDTNGTLQIPVTLPSDRGLYRCVASNSAGAASSTVRVHVSSLPPVVQQPREEHLLFSPGRPAYAHCSARGAPPPSLRWRIPDGTQVRPSQFLHGNLFVLPNGTLHILKVGPQDAGSYECTASNTVGTSKRTVKPLPVSPFTKARIVSTSPSPSTVNYGEILKLYCSVTGNPTPIVIWRTPNRKLVDMHYSFDQRLKVYQNGTLLIQAVTEKDGGEYLCITRNKVADDFRLLRVDVATRPAKIEPKQPPNHTVSLGKPLKMDCQASGLPHPAVRWSLPDGTMVNGVLQEEENRERPRQLTLFDNGTLLVPAVGMGEEGEYMCYAENQAGLDTMKVKVKVLRTSPPTFIDETSLNVIKLRQGASAMIPCQSRGDPAPTVMWFSPARRVIPQRLGSGYYSERIVVVSDGTLKVRLVQNTDAGNYTCQPTSVRRSNSLGHNRNTDTRNSEQNPGTNNNEVATVRTSNQTVLLPCPSQGSPSPRLSWLLPGNGMLPAPYYGSRLTVHRNGSLELRGVRMSDSGTLVCVVKSERGDMLIRVELEVTEKRSQQEDVKNPPQSLIPRSVAQLLHQQRIQSSPGVARPVTSSPSASESKVSNSMASLVSTINGETFRLPCPASTTEGSLFWTLPSGRILSRGESGDSGRYTVHEDGTLVIKQASVFDRGTYSCKFSSHDSASVSVLTVPVIVIAYPPRITAGPSPVTYTSQGVAVELPCLTIATPRATVTWEAPDLTQLRVMGQPRIYGNRYLSPQGSLVIQNPTHRDTGFYRCTAKNVIGVDSKATYLHVI